MLPDTGGLSSTPLEAPFLPPRDRFKHPLIEYELGGVALNDPSEGLQVRTWRVRAVNGEFIIDAPGVAPTSVLATTEVIVSVSLAFDQNMQPTIAWENADGECKLYWFDPTIPDFTTLTLPAGSRTPRCSLDDHRDIADIGGWSDVILAYMRDASLYYRQLRDRYATEYLLQADLDGADLDQVGLTDLLRFQFRILGGPTNTPAPISIERVLRDICGRTGVPGIHAADHSDNLIDGYVLTRETSALSAIAPIRTVGLFDIVERGPQLRFPARGKAPVATLSTEDMGAHVDGSEPPARIEVVKRQDVELPRQVRLRYQSVSRDYERGEQLSPVRHGTVSVNDVSVDVPVAMSDAKAAQVAEIMFREAWASRWTYQTTIDISFAGFEPADVILVPDEGRLYRTRIVAINDSGLMLRELQLIRDDDGSYVSFAMPLIELKPSSGVVLLGETELVFLDLPPLRFEQDNDPSFYVAAKRVGIGQSWPGARIFKSIDGETYQNIATIANQVIYGTVVSAPDDGDPHTWDNDRELIVDIEHGTLESRTDAAVLAGANAAAIGSDGRWHIVQFANADLVSAGRYRLTRLLQGRRGTEHLIGDWQTDDAFVLVSGPGVIRPTLQIAELGASRIYRPVTNGAPFADATDDSFTGNGQALETFSPCRVRGTRDGGDNLTITWLRRDRLSQTLRDGVPVPMSEDSEAYEVDILDGPGGSVVRQLPQVSSETDTYSAANQTTDFGSPQASVTVRIYQLSAVVGRGTPVEATI